MFLKTNPFMKLTRTTWTFVIFFIVTFGIGTAQNKDKKISKTEEKTQSNKKHKSVLFKIAEAAYKDAQYELASEKYTSFISKNKGKDSSIFLKLADCYWQMRNYSKAIDTYKLVASDQCDDLVKIRIAELYARKNNYKLAGEWLENVNGYDLKMETYKNKKTLASLKKDSSNWNIGFSNINSDFREFSPYLKNNTLFFSTNKPIAQKEAYSWDGNNFSYLQEISSLTAQKSTVDKTTYKTAENINSNKIKYIYECGANTPNYKKYRRMVQDKVLKAGNINSRAKTISVNYIEKHNIATLSFDENDNVYFSSNYEETNKKGVNHICIREGKYTSANGITDTKIPPFGDSNSYSVMHPTINKDGTLLIFSSDKENGYGGFDLYYAQRETTEESWGEMHLFGKNINTNGNEVFPTITNDGYLFFSSDAMAGLGGLDIYYLSIQNAINDIGSVENISYPINSSGDDFGWTQDKTGKNGFFTSDRYSNNDNIYSFNYSGDEFKNESRLVYGFVLDKLTLKPVKNATVFLYSVGDEEVVIAKTDDKGKYQFLIDKNGEIILKAAAKSYTSECILVQINNEDLVDDKNPPRNILLSRTNVGDVIWKSNDINYDFDKSDIRSDAELILKKLSVFLKKNDNVTVELNSHTDSRGSDEYNLQLSQKRAESVVNYLIKQGIDKSIIIAKGYGESELINNCGEGVICTEVEHQANRRTEVKVSGYQVNKDELKKAFYKFKDKEKVNINLLPKDFFNYCE